MSEPKRQNSITWLNFSHDVHFCLPTKVRQEETSKVNIVKSFSSRIKHTR